LGNLVIDESGNWGIGESGNRDCTRYRACFKSAGGSPREAKLPDSPITRLPDVT
jgi:hypothetical protein